MANQGPTVVHGVQKAPRRNLKSAQGKEKEAKENEMMPTNPQTLDPLAYCDWPAIYVYTHIMNIYMYLHIEYTYICTHVKCIHVIYIYIYVYTYIERDVH